LIANTKSIQLFEKIFSKIMNTNITNWIPICKIDDIPSLGARRIKKSMGAEVAVFRNAEDEIFAVLDACPHKGGPLSQGIVFGNSVACPLHNWTIDLSNGCAKAPDEGCVKRFKVELRGTEIYMDSDELNSPDEQH